MTNWREHLPQLRDWAGRACGVSVDTTGLDPLKAEEVMFVACRFFGRCITRHYRWVADHLRRSSALPHPWDVEAFVRSALPRLCAYINHHACLTGRRRRLVRHVSIFVRETPHRKGVVRFSNN